MARVVTALLSLVTVPLIVSSLGVERFGALSLVLSLPGLGGFLDAGLGAGIRTASAEAHARGDAQGEVRSFVSGLVMLLGASMVMAVLVSPFLFWTDWAVATSVQGSNIKLGLSAAAVVLMFLLSVPLLAASRAIEGFGAAHIVAAAGVVPSLVLLGGAYLLQLNESRNVLAFAVLSGLSGLASGVLLTVIVVRRLYRRPARFERHNSALMRSMWTTSWPMLIIGVALSASYSTDSIVVGSLLGARAVGQYSIAARLSQLLTLVIYSTAPVLWVHYVRRRTEAVQETMRGVVGVSVRYAGVTALLAAGFVLLGPRLSMFWTSGTVDVGRSLFAAFAAWAIVLAFQLPLAMFLNDPPGLRFQAWTTSIMAAGNLPLSVILCQRLGPSGPVWSSATCLLLFHALPMCLRLRCKLSVNGSSRNPK